VTLPPMHLTWRTSFENPQFMSFLAEFWKFLKVRKKFWLLPLLVMIVLFGVLLVLAESTALAPFIYTLF
jgi:hypothetical protein